MMTHTHVCVCVCVCKCECVGGVVGVDVGGSRVDFPLFFFVSKYFHAFNWLPASVENKVIPVSNDFPFVSQFQLNIKQ